MSAFQSDSMYTVAVRRNFIAQHWLFGGDWGPENRLHSHHYQVEVQLHGRDLDQHGYLVDIVDIESSVEAQVAYYRDKTLNNLPEFEGLNPSIERLARLLCDALWESAASADLSAVTVKVWENDIAWASFRRERR